MASNTERLARLERRLVERDRVIEIAIAPWLADIIATAPSEPEAGRVPSAPAPEPRCNDCGYVIPRRARFCSGCGVAVAEPSR